MSEIVITPLGTVSPYPKGNMNCPGFLLEYGNKKLLLDCGNGITRFLNFPDDLQNLSIIITHYHKDHFGDLGAIQYASYVYHNLNQLDRKVKIYLPQTDFANNRDAILANNENYCKYVNVNDGDSFNMDDSTITFNDNHSHTIESYVVKIENSEHKIIYTSDIGTTNFDELVNYCHNSDLIICESSFLQKHTSNSKTHMTAYNAGMLAKLSNSKQLVLTHFWPEEDKHLYLLEAEQVFANVKTAEEGKKLILRK